MKKFTFLVAVLVAVAITLPAFAQSGLTDERVGANAQIKMSKIKPVQFASAPSAATWYNATLKALEKGDFYVNTTASTLHYYNGSAWTLVGGGSAVNVIVNYAGEPNAAQYLAASGKALAVGDLVFDSTAKVLKQCTNLTGPVYKPAIYSASGTGVDLKSNENNTGTGVAFILDADNALDDADIMFQLQEATAAFFNIYANGDITKLADQAFTIKASKTNAGSDTAVIIDNANALAGSDTLLGVRNAGTSVFEFSPNGSLYGMVATQPLTLINTFSGTGATGEVGITLRNDGVAALAASDYLVQFVNEATPVLNLYANGDLLNPQNATWTFYGGATATGGGDVGFWFDASTGYTSADAIARFGTGGAVKTSIMGNGDVMKGADEKFTIQSMLTATGGADTAFELKTAAGFVTADKILSLTVNGAEKAYVNGDGKGYFVGADMGSAKITSVLDPAAAQDAATKNYVDTALNTRLGSFPGIDLTNTGDQNLYLVPAGKSAVITGIIIRSVAGAGIADIDLIAGAIGTATPCTDIFAFAADATFTAVTQHRVILAPATASTTALTGNQTCINLSAVGAAGALTATIDVFGYLF